MSRYASRLVDVPEWVSVSAQQPCPVCGAASECSIIEDGEFARCLNTACEWPVLTGGWLHRLADADVRTIKRI